MVGSAQGSVSVNAVLSSLKHRHGQAYTSIPPRNPGRGHIHKKETSRSVIDITWLFIDWKDGGYMLQLNTIKKRIENKGEKTTTQPSFFSLSPYTSVFTHIAKKKYS